MESQLVVSDPEILSGIPIFNGTRVPVKTLLDYLEAGDSLEEFLDDFPTVKREKVLMLLNQVPRIKEAIASIQAGEIAYI
jgi:uncharacterized protein (DUF433 family)